jgi:hypothetical protein
LAGLVAGAAVCLLAPMAQAEFSLQIMNNVTHDGFKIDENVKQTAFTLTTFGGLSASDVTWAGNAGTITAKANIDGYTFQVSGLSNQDTTPSPSLGKVSFNAQVTTNPGAKATSFSYYVADSPVTFPGTSSGPLCLQAAAFTGTTNTAADRVSTQAALTSYGTGAPASHYLTGMAGPLGGVGQSAYSNMLETGPRGPHYVLADIGNIVGTGQVGTTRFWAQAVTAMPEPNGLLIGLLGVPCMAVVLYVLRRRAVRMAGLAA